MTNAQPVLRQHHKHLRSNANPRPRRIFAIQLLKTNARSLLIYHKRPHRKRFPNCVSATPQRQTGRPFSAYTVETAIFGSHRMNSGTKIVRSTTNTMMMINGMTPLYICGKVTFLGAMLRM